MNAAQFAAHLARYPVVRPRDFCARDVGTCPVPPRRAAAAAAGAASPPPPPPPAAAAAAAAAAAPTAAISATVPVLEFWAGLNALLGDAAPGDKAEVRAAVSDFEALHFSLLRDSSLEDAEDALAAVALTAAGAAGARASAPEAAPR